MNVQPYLSFEGRAQEAIDFYKTALGAKVDVVMHPQHRDRKDGPDGVYLSRPEGVLERVNAFPLLHRARPVPRSGKT